MNVKRRLKWRTRPSPPRPTLTGNFAELGVKVGDRLLVSFHSGPKMVGRVTKITPSTLELRPLVRATKKVNV